MQTISDPYRDQTRVYDRLKAEYREHGRLIIAVDFDDTLYDTHKNGWKYYQVIDLLRRWRSRAYIICWSASPQERHQMMWDYFNKEEIPIDAINTNAPGIEVRGPKIYANVYLDDRSGLDSMVTLMAALLEDIEMEESVCSTL